MSRPLTVGSLFSGIGGLDLGLERAGMSVKWQSEIDPYCSRVLAKHWPDVPNLGDITKVDWEHVERVDVVCGGFPCQPFSVAGAQRGRDDPRHLWPHFADALRVLRPRYALLENVPGLLTVGFGEVAGDLADLGYDFEWDCIPAAAVGAPHLRYRIFVVAYAEGQRDQEQSQRPDSPAFLGVGARAGGRSRGGDPAAGVRELGRDATTGETALAYANGGRLEERGERHLEPSGGQRPPFGDDADRLRADVADTEQPGWYGLHERIEPEHLATHTRIGSEVGPDGITAGDRGGRPVVHRTPTTSNWWAVEPDVGRVAHGIPSRVDRLRGLGNAVVPQVAEWIGRQLIDQLG